MTEAAAAPDRTRVRVELGERSYDILIGPGLIAGAGAVFGAAAGAASTTVWFGY